MVAYTFADVADDVCLLSFKIDSMPASVLGVLKDILSVNQGASFCWVAVVCLTVADVGEGIKIHVIPWSPVRSPSCIRFLIIDLLLDPSSLPG